VTSNEYSTSSQWCGAYLLCQGAVFLRSYRKPDGRHAFVFVNDEDNTAWKLGNEWYRQEPVPVDPLAFTDAWHKLGRERQTA
jgi:hypothetical protein